MWPHEAGQQSSSSIGACQGVGTVDRPSMPLTTLKEESGIPKSEQVRRAIRMWLESEGILTPKKRTRRKGGRKKR